MTSLFKEELGLVFITKFDIKKLGQAFVCCVCCCGWVGFCCCVLKGK